MTESEKAPDWRRPARPDGEESGSAGDQPETSGTTPSEEVKRSGLKSIRTRLDLWADVTDDLDVDWPPETEPVRPGLLRDPHEDWLREPAYRFGWDKGHDPYYEGRPWAAVQRDLRLEWEEISRGRPWPQIVHRVRDGYERALGERRPG